MASISRLSVYQGPAGDHNDRAMYAVSDLGRVLSTRLGIDAVVVGHSVAANPTLWDRELAKALPHLQKMGNRIDEVLSAGLVPVTAMTRCAVALATQPRVVSHHPDVVVVWLDAHGDINVPEDTQTGYLGGMAFSGPLGWWDSGLGAGLADAQAVLVGARDLDVAEAERVRSGQVALIPVGPSIGERLAEVIRGRPVYVHVDCDVLEPGTVKTDYNVPRGLSLQDLHDCVSVLAAGDVVGVEIAEYEGRGTAGPDELVDALEPVLTGGTVQ